jgi:hypothetical protein
MLIYRQNSNVPRSWRCTGRREAQNREPVSKDKNLTLYLTTALCGRDMKADTSNNL